MEEQRSIEWFKNRLGVFNGSTAGELIGTPRTKGEIFTDKAKKTILKVIAERHLAKSVLEDDKKFEEYLKREDISSNRAVKWGVEHEDEAVDYYVNFMEFQGCPVTVEECGSLVHKSVPTFHASPDRIIWIDGHKYILEVKCPNYLTHFEARQILKDGDWDSLKKFNPTYYWQVISEIACADAEGAHFIVYDPHSDKPLVLIKLPRNHDVELQLINKILDAEEYIKFLESNADSNI